MGLPQFQFLLFIVGALVLIYLAIDALLRPRNLPASPVGGTLLLFAALWVLAHAFRHNAGNFSFFNFWNKMEYVGIIPVALLWYTYAALHAGEERWLKPYILGILASLAYILLVLIFTNDTHTLMWRITDSYLVNGMVKTQRDFGPGFWVLICYLVGLLLASDIFLIRIYLRTRYTYRLQALTLILVTIAPLVTIAHDVLMLPPFPETLLSPYALLIEIPLTIWALYNLKLGEVGPEAHALIVEGMSDGVLVLNQKRRIQEFNRGAQDILAIEDAELIKATIAVIWPELDQWLNTISQDETHSTELVYPDETPSPRTIEVRVQPLPNWRKEHVGQIILMRDFTAQKAAEEALYRRDAILHSVSLASERFLKNSPEANVIEDVLALLGQATNVSRVHIFENHESSNGKALSSLRYEWVTDGVLPLMNVSHAQNQDWSSAGFRSWQEQLSAGAIIMDHTRDAPDSIRALLEPQDVKSYLIIPVYIEHRWWGHIGLDAIGTERTWAEPEIDALKTAAGLLGTALHRAEANKKERDQQIMETAIRDVMVRLGSSLDLDTVVDHILENLGRVVPHDAGNVMLLEAGVARVVRLYNYAQRVSSTEDVLALRYPIHETPNLLEMVQTKQGIVIENVQDYRGWQHADPIGWISSYMGAPIRVDDTVIGFLNLDSAQPGAFKQTDVARLQSFADQAAVALRNAQLFEAEQQRRSIAETLRRATSVLNTTLNLDDVLRFILLELAEVVTYSSASVQRREGDELVILAGRGFEGRDDVRGLRFPLDERYPNIQVLNSRAPLAIDDVQIDYPHFVDEAEVYDSARIRSWLGVPLMIKERVLGTITIDRTEVDPYIAEDIALAMAFANQSAIAIENARLYEEVRFRAEELEALRQVTLDISAELELEVLLEKLLSNALKLIKVDSGGIYLYDPDRDVLEWTVHVGDNVAPPGSVLKRGEGLSGKVLESGEAQIVNNYAEWEGRAAIYESFNWPSVLAVPIKWGDQFLGVINTVVMDDPEHTFSERDMRIVNMFTSNAAIAIRNAELLRATRERAAQLELIERVGRTASATLDLEQLLQQTVELVNKTFGYHSTSIGLVEGDDLVIKTTSLDIAKASINGARLLITDNSIACWAVNHGEALIVPDTAQDPRYNQLPFENVPARSELAVPIRLGEEVIGVLNAESLELNAFDDLDVITLTTIADQLATAIHNANLYTQIQDYATKLEQRVEERTIELIEAFDRLQDLNRMKDEFVGNVSHELRTPVANIKLHHFLLKNRPEQTEKYLNTLKRETDRLEFLVEDLLLLSQIDQRPRNLAMETVDLNLLIETHIADRQELVKERNLTLLAEPYEAVPAVRGDAQLLEKLLSILVTNAVTYTPPGGKITVSISSAQQDERAYNILCVSDTGRGIPPDEIEHLFERFYRGTAAREEYIAGTGLGLAIAREIVDLHHGRIKVESEGIPGKGAQFRVWLPQV